MVVFPVLICDMAAFKCALLKLAVYIESFSSKKIKVLQKPQFKEC